MVDQRYGQKLQYPHMPIVPQQTQEAISAPQGYKPYDSKAMNVLARIVNPEAYNKGRAARALQAGDMNAAANAMYSMGNFGAGLQLQDKAQQQVARRNTADALSKLGGPQPDYEGAQRQLLAAGDIDTYGRVTEWAQKADKQQLEQAKMVTEAFGHIQPVLSGMSYEQRVAQMRELAPMLISMGVPPEEIAEFDPTDENLKFVKVMSMGLKDYLGSERQSQKDAFDRDLQERKFGEVRRKNRAAEADRDRSNQIRERAVDKSSGASGAVMDALEAELIKRGLL